MVKKALNKNRSDEPKKIHVTLPDDLHKKVKVKCVYEELSIQSYVEKLIREDMKGYRVEIQRGP